MTFAAMNSANGRRLVAVLARSEVVARIRRFMPLAPHADHRWAAAKTVPVGWLLEIEPEKDARLLKLAAENPVPRESPGSLFPELKQLRRRRA